MIIDIHTHVFPERIRHNRVDFFPQEDAFKSLYKNERSNLIGVEHLIEEMDRAGVNRSVIFGFPWQSLDTSRAHNDYILESVAKYPDRLIGFCCFGLGTGDVAREIERTVQAGLSGVGELAVYDSGFEKPVLDMLEPVMEVCQQMDLPILIHANESIGHQYAGKSPMTIEQIYALISRFQNNRIILAHWGGGIFFFSLLKKEIREHMKNVYFDIAASPFLYDETIYRVAVDILGSEKILFGSDYPLISPTRYLKELNESGISQTAVDNIISRNAMQLLKIKE